MAWWAMWVDEISLFGGGHLPISELNGFVLCRPTAEKLKATKKREFLLLCKSFL